MFAVHGKEPGWCDYAQIGIAGDFAGSPACPLGKISFGQCLQPPRDPAEQMFPVTGSRFFLKHFAILLAQSCQSRPAQVLDFHQYRIVHSFSVSSRGSSTTDT
jgi:hypothetical protein